MSFIAVSIGGSAVLGFLGSKRSAEAAESGADSAAQAQMYATDRTIEATEKFRKESIEQSKKSGLKSYRAVRDAAIGSHNALVGGSREAQRHLLGANDATAGHLIAGAGGVRDSLISGAGLARDSLLAGATRAEREALAGSRKAQRSIVGANQKNMQFFKNIFEKSAGALGEWRHAGRYAIKSIEKGLKSGKFSMDNWKFEADPGYKFRLQQGERQLERQGSARGNLLSGSQLAAAQEYGQNFASEEYDRAYGREAEDRERRFNQLLGVSDRGQQAVNDTNAMRDVMARRVGDARLNIGDARAEGMTDRAGIRGAKDMYAAETNADFYNTRGDARAGFYDTRGRVRAGAADVRGNILAGGATDRAGYKAAMLTDIGGAADRRWTNLANTTAGANTNALEVTSNAWGNYGTNVGEAALVGGQAQADAILGGSQALNTGIQNWLTYSLSNRNQAPAGTAAGTGAASTMQAPRNWLNWGGIG